MQIYYDPAQKFYGSILSLLFNLKTSESQLEADHAERHQENAMISYFTMAKNCFLTLPSLMSHTYSDVSPYLLLTAQLKLLPSANMMCIFSAIPCYSLDTKCPFPNSTFQIPLSFNLYLKIYFLYETFLNLFPLIFLFASSP